MPMLPRMKAILAEDCGDRRAGGSFFRSRGRRCGGASAREGPAAPAAAGPQDRSGAGIRRLDGGQRPLLRHTGRRRRRLLVAIVRRRRCAQGRGRFPARRLAAGWQLPRSADRSAPLGGGGRRPRARRPSIRRVHSSASLRAEPADSPLVKEAAASLESCRDRQ
jgi:hypothetical protein